MNAYFAYKTREGLGACFSRKFLEIRCSETASEAILGQKHSYNSYLARGVLHSIFSCRCMHLLTHELAIYLRTLLRASFRRSGVNRLCARSALVSHEQTRISPCTLVWTAVILNNSETSGSLSNGRILKMCSLELYIKSFKRGVRSNTLEPPLPTAWKAYTHTLSMFPPDLGCCSLHALCYVSCYRLVSHSQTLARRAGSVVNCPHKPTPSQLGRAIGVFIAAGFILCSYNSIVSRVNEALYRQTAIIAKQCKLFVVQESVF